MGGLEVERRCGRAVAAAVVLHVVEIEETLDFLADAVAPRADGCLEAAVAARVAVARGDDLAVGQHADAQGDVVPLGVLPRG